MKLKKICILMPSLSRGGAEILLIRLANAFEKKGMDVLIATTFDDLELKEQISPTIKTVQLTGSNWLVRFAKICRFLLVERPQLLYTTNLLLSLLSILSKYLCLLNTRVVIRIENTYSKLPPQTRGQAVVRFLGRHLYRFADKVVVISEGTQKDALSMFNISCRNTSLITNPAIDEQFYERAKIEVTHPWFAQPDPVIVAIGNESPAKDHLTLVRAVSEIPYQLNIRLLIIGRRPTNDYIAKEVIELGLSDKVDLLGPIANPLPYLVKCDLFVLSSTCEGLPTVLIEALACGCRIVSTDCESGPREILQGGRFGKLVPISNPSLLSKAILSELQQDQTNLRQEKITFAKQTYSLATSVDTHIELFNGVLVKGKQDNDRHAQK